MNWKNGSLTVGSAGIVVVLGLLTYQKVSQMPRNEFLNTLRPRPDAPVGPLQLQSLSETVIVVALLLIVWFISVRYAPDDGGHKSNSTDGETE